MEETWKPIKDCPNYEVSSHGRVRSRATGEWKVLKMLTRSDNLQTRVEVSLYDGQRKFKAIHRLVAEAFIPNPENKRIVNYKDGNKLNFHYTNLRWATSAEDSRHRKDTSA